MSVDKERIVCANCNHFHPLEEGFWGYSEYPLGQPVLVVQGLRSEKCPTGKYPPVWSDHPCDNPESFTLSSSEQQLIIAIEEIQSQLLASI